MSSARIGKLDSRDDLLAWMEQMLPSDFDYCTRAGASYPDPIRRLEALLRPLWGLWPVHFGPSDDKPHTRGASCSEQGIALARLGTSTELYLRELRRRVEHDELPEITTANRQIAVETAVLSFALAKYRARFLELFSETGRRRLVDWLGRLNDIEFPAGNWYFFLAFANAALRCNGLRYSPERLDFALAGIDSFAEGDHWYTDGPGEQRDYYVAFAFHFYGLLYARYFAPQDDRYAQKFRHRAVAFAEDFSYWFDAQGRSLPFGRSLTYRFAHVSFWSALVVTGSYRDAALSLGQIKGIILRNLRFWQQRPITAPRENNLLIGYGYGQPLMAEDYNAPGSPMWAFKAFLLLDLPADHAFWHTEEETLDKAALRAQPEPGFLLASSARQTTALSVRQCPRNPQLYRAAEKYGKFAYSTFFGFNVGRGPQGLEQFALDSTLAFSVAGHDQYASRLISDGGHVAERYALSRWRLWGSQIAVTSFLVPLSAECHARVHLVETTLAVDVAEGGFPLHGWNRKYDQMRLGPRRVSVTNAFGCSWIEDALGGRDARVVSQGPNTNLYSPEKNAIPALAGRLDPGHHVLACVVGGEPAQVLPDGLAADCPAPGPNENRPQVTVGVEAGRVRVSWGNETVDMTVEGVAGTT
ncbi:hypothetical protein SAMN05443377_13416 [Propionibacterium cyclohexanicum]|uniref:DUF2264 domain-containing protein n=2 Tax=Propionibacterium cyclohexanicum TaxID=64702 RepID=A0A1H9U0B5_9ACTN|nr:hypothetical protein SAMN05443377_13416 [Propionibacterium cyclohexanicum]